MITTIKKHKLASLLFLILTIMASFNLYKGLTLSATTKNEKNKLENFCTEFINTKVYSFVLPDSYKKIEANLPKDVINKQLSSYKNNLLKFTNDSDFINNEVKSLKELYKNYKDDKIINLGPNSTNINIISSFIINDEASVELSAGINYDYYGTHIDLSNGYIDEDGYYICYDDGTWYGNGEWYPDQGRDIRQEKLPIVTEHYIEFEITKYKINLIKENDNWLIKNYETEVVEK